MTDNTVLRLHGMGVVPYSARGLTQSLAPIQAAQQLRRDVNGNSQDFSASQFRKFASTITGSDVAPPAINAVWPGTALTVECIAELAYETSTGGPERSEVPGSSREEGDFTYYRPSLDMRVVSFSVQKNEWGAVVSWSLDLEEV